MFQLSQLPRTLPAALRDLETPGKEAVRLSALKDLVRHIRSDQNAAVVRRLEQVLAHDESPALRAEAALALADVGDAASLPVLLRASDDLHTRVRQMAVLALGEVAPAEHSETLEVVAAALRDDAPALRFQALIAWHRLRSAAAEPTLTEATFDEDARVRHIALRLLEELVLEPAGELPCAVADRTTRLLADADPGVRVAAAILLARGGSTAGQQVLAAAINERWSGLDPEDEQAAIRLAGELGLVSAIQGLRRRAFGLLGFTPDPFAYQARVALAQLGDPRAIETILRGLVAWSRDARTLAVAAAGQARLQQARPLLVAMRASGRAEPDAIAAALAQIDDVQMDRLALGNSL